MWYILLESITQMLLKLTRWAWKSIRHLEDYLGTANCIVGMKQYYNISIYCNSYYCNTIQYGLKEISIIIILHIAIYCDILQYIAMFVVLML